MVDVSEKRHVGTNPKDDVTRKIKRFGILRGFLKSPHYLKNSEDLGVNVICILSFVTRGINPSVRTGTDPWRAAPYLPDPSGSLKT